MNVSTMIKLACTYANVTQSELARRLDTSPQNMNKRLNHGHFKVSELEEIAEKLGAKFEYHFKFHDGTTI